MDSAENTSSAPASTPSTSPPDDPVIDLRILTQSPELSNQLHFHALRTSTTIGELKQHITQATSSRIPVESQRLIYKGRRLAVDGDTLATVLGQDAVNPPAPLVIHMVHTDPPPRAGRPPWPSAALPPNVNTHTARNPPAALPQAHMPFPQLPAPFPFPINAIPQPFLHPLNPTMFNPLQNMMQPPVTGVTGIHGMQGGAQGGHQAGNQELHTTAPPWPSSAPLSGQMQNAGASDMTTTNQGVAPNGQRFTMTVNTQTMTVPMQGMPPVHPFFPMPQMMQPLPWPPAANIPPHVMIPANVQQGLPVPFGPGRGQQNASEQLMRADQLRHSTSQIASQLRHLRAQIEDTVRRGPGPQAGTVANENLPQQNTPQRVLNGAIALEGEIARLTTQLDGYAAEEAALRQLLSLYARQAPSAQLAAGHGQPYHTMTTAANGAYPAMAPILQPNQPQASIVPWGQQGPSQHPLGEPNVSQTHPLNGQSHLGHFRGGRGSAEDVASPSTLQAGEPSASSSISAPMVFLLSSPTGPSALLLSPRGTYASATSSVSIQATANPTIARASPQHALATGVNATHQNDASRPNAPAPPNQGAAQAARQPLQEQPHRRVAFQDQQPQQQQGAGPRDLIAILLSLGGPLWLIIRIAGFLWFFGAGGGGLGRHLIIAGIIMIVAGLQGGLLGDRWDRVRRHFQRLVPLAPERAAEAAAGAPPQGRREGEGQGGEQAERRPTPEQAAQRLIREREQRERGWLREHLEPVERAVALFVASLWPGVGERHIRAREEAEMEARRVAEEARVEEERRVVEERARIEVQQAGREASAQRRGGIEDGHVGQRGDESREANLTEVDEDESAGGEGKGKGEKTVDEVGVATSSAVEPGVDVQAGDSGEESAGVRHREPQGSGEPIIEV